MSDITELDESTLESELQARKQRTAAEQAERQRQAEADELARYQTIAATFDGIEEAKKAETADYRAAFTAAVAAADFQAAFAAWVGERSTRYFRTALRDKYRTALVKTGGNAGAVADLRYYDPDLLKRLEEEGDRQARLIGYGAADELLGV